MFPDLTKKQHMYKHVSLAKLWISAKYLKNNASITQKKHILSFFFLYPGYMQLVSIFYHDTNEPLSQANAFDLFCSNFGVFSSIRAISFSAMGSSRSNFSACSPSKSSPEKGLRTGAGYCWSSPSTSTLPKLSLLSLWISVLSPSSVWASWRSCERISSCMTTKKQLNQHVGSHNVYT